MTGLIQKNTAEAGGLKPFGIGPASSAPSEFRVPAPAGVRLVSIPPATTAHDACAVLLALHGASIEQNLSSALGSIDPEGPHQLRVALRRLRVMLRVFRPIMAKRVNAALTETARDVGRIAGELRDADVMIDQLLSPGAVRVADRAVIGALNGWRQELRGRVRAKLTAAGAANFSRRLSHIAATTAWRRKVRTRGEERASELICASSADFVENAARAGSRLPDLSHAELHDFRKTAKGLRYCLELGVAAGEPSYAPQVTALKRVQDALGYANDMAALERFNPPLVCDAGPFDDLRTRIIGERRSASAARIADVAARWQGLMQSWPPLRDAAERSRTQKAIGPTVQLKLL